MVNRIPNCYLLTNKLGLLTSLQHYEQVLIALRLSRVVKLRMADFVPDTFRLDDSFEQRSFFEAFARTSRCISIYRTEFNLGCVHIHTSSVRVHFVHVGVVFCTGPVPVLAFLQRVSIACNADALY